jgi:hypothetical protein
MRVMISARNALMLWFAVPHNANDAKLHGWHRHNRVMPGDPRLGFVCTGQTVEGNAWRLMYVVSRSETMFPAWNALWKGTLAVHNRDLALSVEQREGTTRWRVASHG